MATAVLTGGTRTAAVTDGGHGWSSGVPRPGKPGPASSRNGPSNGRPWTRTAGLAEPKPSQERSLLPGALLSDRDVGIPFPCGIPPSADLRTLIEATPATASPSRPDLAAVGAGPGRSRHDLARTVAEPIGTWVARFTTASCPVMASPSRSGSKRLHPPQEHRVGGLTLLLKHRLDVRQIVPAAGRVEPAGRLDDAVKGDVLGDNQVSHAFISRDGANRAPRFQY
jgi:hypothetical protein